MADACAGMDLKGLMEYASSDVQAVMWRLMECVLVVLSIWSTIGSGKCVFVLGVNTPPPMGFARPIYRHRSRADKAFSFPKPPENVNHASKGANFANPVTFALNVLLKDSIFQWGRAFPDVVTASKPKIRVVTTATQCQTMVVRVHAQ